MTLVYISHCAIHPDGTPDPFMMQEMPWLHEHFDRVIMVGQGGVRTMTGEEEGAFATLRPPVGRMLSWIRLPFTAELWRELRHMGRDGRLTLRNAGRLAAFTRRGLQMHLWIERMLRDAEENALTLYSCWMSCDAFAGALSKRKHPKARFVARGHAFDIDIERNELNPYLMKRYIAQQADGLYLISRTAKAQYMAYMKGSVPDGRVHVLAMGSAGQPVEAYREAPLFTQGVLRVLSCAQLIPIKQVPLLVEALSRWEGGPLCWTHIGGGEGEEELRRLVDEKLSTKENVICELLSTMDAAKIQQLYDTRAFDVFVNTSRKEGVPVSIMEAMRHGTPVIAPAVGGIPELVTPEVGWLYDPARGADGVLEALHKLAALSREQTEAMRSAVRERWNRNYCSGALLPKLFPDAHIR